MSAFSAWHRAKGQRVPNDCQQHSALPKTMPTDAASPCWSENWQHHELQLQREAWPTSAHAHWHSTQDSSKTCSTVCAEGLHFSAFHWICTTETPTPRALNQSTKSIMTDWFNAQGVGVSVAVQIQHTVSVGEWTLFALLLVYMQFAKE